MLLYQRNPEPGKPHAHGDSWKNLCGHDANSNRLRHRHRRNNKLASYKLAGTVNILQDQSIQEHARFAARTARVFKQNGVDCFYIREITKRTNRIHYHLIVTSNHTPEEIKTLLRKANPTLKLRIYLHPVKKSEWWASYLSKTTKYHKPKVVLFAKDVNLDKHGQWGDFWKTKAYTAAQKKAFNQQRREETHRRVEASTDPVVQAAADYLADATGMKSDDIANHYARELMTDPTLYQTYANDAAAYHGQPATIVQPFAFSPCPQLTRPPRKKRGTTKTPLPAFKPDQLESFTSTC